MGARLLPSVILFAISLSNAFNAVAFETDQYNLPPEPLYDIGEEMSAHVLDSISLAVRNIDLQISMHEACLRGDRRKDLKCSSRDKEEKKLAELRAPHAITEAVYEQLGEGTIFTGAIAKWFTGHKFAHEPSRYKTSFRGSIFLTRPIDYLTLSPTVRMYGSEFGFDKIDHFFQQGYTYYGKYADAIKDGKTPDEASRKAVNWGKMTERTYFGTLVSGVYSNADLFANYAGMKFYQGLTKQITLGTEVLPPVVFLEDGKWKIDPRADLLRPFIADQMNEALNPSGYTFLLHKFVKKVVRDRACRGWRKLYPSGTAAEFERRSASLEKWNGEDYGFSRKSRSVPIAICFEDKLPAH